MTPLHIVYDDRIIHILNRNQLLNENRFLSITLISSMINLSLRSDIHFVKSFLSSHWV